MSFTIPEAAQIAGVSPSQLRRWIKLRASRPAGSQDFLPLARKSSGQGVDALLLWKAVVQAAIAGRLAELGVSAFDALNAAQAFTEQRYDGKTWLLVSQRRTAILGKTVSLPDSIDALTAGERRAVAVLRVDRLERDLEACSEAVLRRMRPRNTRLMPPSESAPLVN